MRVYSGLVAAAVVASLVGGVSAAVADTVSRDTMSRRFLDYCVNTQVRVKDIDRMPMVDKCRKAASTALSSFEGDSFEAPSRSKLTGPQEKAIREAIAAVFAKK